MESVEAKRLITLRKIGLLVLWLSPLLWGIFAGSLGNSFLLVMISGAIWSGLAQLLFNESKQKYWSAVFIPIFLCTLFTLSAIFPKQLSLVWLLFFGAVVIVAFIIEKFRPKKEVSEPPPVAQGNTFLPFIIAGITVSLFFSGMIIGAILNVK